MPGWNFTIAKNPARASFVTCVSPGANKAATTSCCNCMLAVLGPFARQAGSRHPYEAGPALNTFNLAAVRVDSHLPDDWVVVTRELCLPTSERSR